MRNVIIAVFALSLIGCGKISEEKEMQMIQNSTNLMNAFTKDCSIPELHDDKLSNRGISFTWNEENTNDDLYVNVIGIKDRKKIDKIVDNVTKLAAKLKIKNSIYLRLYGKYLTDGSYSSKDMYQKRKIK